MSLLNDALRAAEQRQTRPAVAAAYVGQNQTRKRSRRWLVPLLLLMIAILVTAALYERFSGDSVNAPFVAVPEPVSEVTKASPVEASVLPPAPPVTEVVESNISPVVVSDALTSMPGNVEEPVVVSTEFDPSSPSPSPSPSPVINSREEAEQPSAQLASATTAPERAAIQEGTIAEAVAPVEPAPAAENLSESPAIPAVKQQRETPETADLRASRQLSKLLQAGNIAAAEALMSQLERAQAAPVSRGVLARSLLIQDMPERALRWLSGTETENDPTLRLLKSRGLLSTGDLPGAVTTLLQNVPPVKSHIEYRVTLATLLQQSGQGMESARQWSALISVDDGRAAWWVGLAIALESQGEARAAVRAYSQAAQLPGLSPSLVDYVRERMHKLQAG